MSSPATPAAKLYSAVTPAAKLPSVNAVTEEKATQSDKKKKLNNKPRKLCLLCNEPEKYCHSKDFGAYCVMYTQVQFAKTPTSWLRKQTSQSFIRAYNRILDYVKFRRSKSNDLYPEARYLPPACLKGDLDWLHIDITDDIEDFMKGERGNNLVIENNWQERENIVRSYDDVRGCIDAQTVDSEITDKLAACETNCPHCLLDRKDCHDHNFGEYCTKKVKRYFHLYPTAMTRETARQFFLKHYHAALHVLIWAKYDHFADESKYVDPPNCLFNTME